MHPSSPTIENSHLSLAASQKRNPRKFPMYACAGEILCRPYLCQLRLPFEIAVISSFP